MAEDLDALLQTRAQLRRSYNWGVEQRLNLSDLTFKLDQNARVIADLLEKSFDPLIDPLDYTPRTFHSTQNTLGSFMPAGLSHGGLSHQEIKEFQAERLLEAGYVVRYDPERAAQILADRKI